MVLDWIREGNAYWNPNGGPVNPLVPDHPRLSAEQAHDFCIIAFPVAWLGWNSNRQVGSEASQLLPGTYKYRTSEGGDQVNEPGGCSLYLNTEREKRKWSRVSLVYGQPFEFTFHSYHGTVSLNFCGADYLYRIGD